MSHRRPGLTLVLLLVAALQALGAQPADAAVPDRTTDSRPHFLVGASTPHERLGQLDLERVFRAELGSPGPRPTATTFTVWDEGAVRAWVRAAPPGSAVDFWHEPENDPQAMPASLWAQRARQLADIVVQEQRVGQVTPAATLMAWTLDPRAGRQDLLDTLLSAEVLQALRDAGGVLGWDSYAGPAAGRTPEQMFAAAAQFSTDHDLPWAVMETGARQSEPNPDAAVAWHDRFLCLAGDLAGHQIAATPRWVLAWNPTDRNDGDFAVQRFPTPPPSGAGPPTATAGPSAEAPARRPAEPDRPIPAPNST